VEHFRALRDRLSEDGTVCQWLHLYRLSATDLACIVASFLEVFPDTTMWQVSRNKVDVALIARKHPWKVDLPRLAERAESNPEIEESLRQAGFDRPTSIVSSLLLGPDDLRALSKGGQLNTDDLPRLEFSAPRSLYRTDARETNLALLTWCKSQPQHEIIEFGTIGRDDESPGR
jgi:spermidine synthase